MSRNALLAIGMKPITLLDQLFIVNFKTYTSNRVTCFHFSFNIHFINSTKIEYLFQSVEFEIKVENHTFIGIGSPIGGHNFSVHKVGSWVTNIGKMLYLYIQF